LSNLREEFEAEIGKYCKYVQPNNFEYSINISLKHKYMYVETPKAGCSSIKTLLQRMELESTTFYRPDFEDIHNRNFSPLLKPSQVGSFNKFISRNDIVKFCFSRNPFTRLLSAYLEKIEQTKPQKRQILMHLGKNPSKTNEYISFDEFVNVVCEQPIINMDPHWRVQYYQTFQDTIKYDFIGKLEFFDRDILAVMMNINTDFDKYMTNELRHSTKAVEFLDKYYTPSLADKVKAKYMKDFEFFNYSDELSDAGK
jgi:hypothetical protein